MITVFVATSNKGKQAEIEKYAKRYGKDIILRFPDETNEITVDESGTTFEENALLKATAYRDLLGDDSLIYVGDDSGIKIPALNNEPGVYSRRWAGYEMSDDEIRKYCMEKMQGLTGDQRIAVFETVLVALKDDQDPVYYRGTMSGRILDKMVEDVPIDGFPFTSLFWVDELNMPIYQVYMRKPEERGEFHTHREKALKELFENLTA